VKLKRLNNLSPENATRELMKCCGSTSWVKAMVEHRPFEKKFDLFSASEVFWFELEESDWLEAFKHHPKLGDVTDLEEKFPETSDLSAKEQKKINKATAKEFGELRELNQRYEEKFGFIFISCAKGKSAPTILSELTQRCENSIEKEIKNATIEQNKITRIRLEANF